MLLGSIQAVIYLPPSAVFEMLYQTYRSRYPIPTSDIIWHSLMTNVCACKIYDTDSKSWKHSGQHHIQREASSEHEVSSQGESNLYTVQKTWSVCLKAEQLLLLSPSPSKIHYLELMHSCAFSSYEELYKSTMGIMTQPGAGSWLKVKA